MSLWLQAIAWLVRQGDPCYLVGGCVRDRLLGRELYDLDLVTYRDGLKLARRLADSLRGTYYPLDRDRGTGRAILTSDEGDRLVVDIADMRGHDLAADLADRDFTINAMAADVRTPYNVIDNHGGLADLRARLIRPVSDRSIQNDPVRALRAVRLAASLDFGLAEEAEYLIRRDGPGIASVSSERIRDELARMLGLPRASDALCQLDGLHLLTLVISELEPLRELNQPPPHHLRALAHSIATVSALESVLASLPPAEAGGASFAPASNSESRHPRPDLSERLEPLSTFASQIHAHLAQIVSDQRPRIITLKLAALLHDTGKPVTRSIDSDGRILFLGHEDQSARIAGRVLRRLRFSTGEVRIAETIVRHHMRPLLLAREERVSSRAMYRFFRDTEDAGVDVLLHGLADHLATYPSEGADRQWLQLLALTDRMLGHYYGRQAVDIAPPRLISGHDLMAELDIPPGPQIGKLLDLVREAQVCGHVGTRTEALDLVRSFLDAGG